MNNNRLTGESDTARLDVATGQQESSLGSGLTGALGQSDLGSILSSDGIALGSTSDSDTASRSSQRQAVSKLAAKAAGQELDLMILGDSLTADPPHGRSGNSFGDILEGKLDGRGWNVDVEALSTSGFRTDEALGSLQAYFNNGGTAPDAVIIELGTNDALQEVALSSVQSNLQSILDLLDSKGVDAVMVAGSYGYYKVDGRGYDDKKTAKAFEKIFATEAKEADASLYKYFLNGVLNKSATYTVDGLHPNEAGHQLIAQKMLKGVEKLLNEAAGTTSSAKASVSASNDGAGAHSSSLDHIISSAWNND